MFSKSCLMVLALSFSMTLTSCKWNPFQGSKIGEQNPKKEQIKLNLGKYSCMSNIGEKVKDYFHGRMDEKRVHLFMDCIRTALNRFEYYAKGKEAGSYSPSELQSFLNREFLNEKKLTDGFIEQIMKFKVVLLGGNERVITKTEFSGIIDFLNFVEEEALANQPFLKMYRASMEIEDYVPNSDELDKAKSQLLTSGKKFSNRLTKSGGTYNIESFADLVIEKRKFLHENPDEKERDPRLLVNALTAFKTVVTGREGSAIEASMWPTLMDSVVHLYSYFLNYKIYLSKIPVTYGEGLHVFRRTTNDALSLLQKIIDVHPNGILRFEHSDLLIESLGENKLLPEGIRAESIKQAYKHLVSRVFVNPVTSPSKQTTSGFTAHTVNEMRAEFLLWAETQKYLSDLAEKEIQKHREIKDLTPKVFNNYVNKIDFGKVMLADNDLDQARRAELDRIISGIRPLFRDGDDRVQVVYQSEFGRSGLRHGMHNLTRMNIIRALTRLLFRGFAGNDREINLKGINEDELEEFYKTIKLLGEDIKFMDPRKVESGRKLFAEANMFSFSGSGLQPVDEKGSHLLNFNEISETLALMWSGGQVRTALYDSIKAKCVHDGVGNGPLDVFQQPKIPRFCFQKYFGANDFKEINNLPHMRRFLLSLSEAQYEETLNSLITIAWHANEDPAFIEYAQIATISTVLHYAEVLFVSYDLDQNGVLNAHEIMRSFPRFHHYLARSVAKRDEDGEYPSVERTKAIFAFMIESGREPNTDGFFPTEDERRVFWLETRYFNNDPVQEYGSLPNFQLDRAGVISVLRMLAESTRLKPQ